MLRCDASAGYAEAMIARCLVALDGARLTDSELAAGLLAECERREIVGSPVEATGDTPADWNAAMAACPVPEGARILHWWRDE